MQEKAHNLQQIDNVISRLEVLDYDNKAAAHYGDIRASLERNGTPIGVNDLHIAGHSRNAYLILATNNLREFERVNGLRVGNWLSKL